LRQGVGRHFGPDSADVAAGLKLRHDHGSNHMAEDFQHEIAFLGMVASPSFVRQPEGNGVAEGFFRTLKEQLLWVRTFHTLEELQDALRAFRIWYNANWLIQRHGHRTPDQVRADQHDEAIAHTPSAMAI
jgi:transposase InsO family protein